jgi:CubicO group peptidase (beta-lactamase class C family)
MQFPALMQSRFSRVDRYIQREYIDTGRLAGAQIAIQHRGTLHQRCFGFLDRERTRRMNLDCIFRIYSMTKPITCVAAMMLVERGLMRLDDEVARYIPSWSGLAVSGAAQTRPMRIIDLLTHCSGLTAGFQYRTEIDALYRQVLSMRSDGLDLAAFVDELSRFPLEFEPGTAWNYSVSTDVLGFVIQEVSGLSFRDFLKSQIFDPLKMTDTDFHVPAAKRARLAECYVRRPGEPLGRLKDSFEPDLSAIPTFYSGGGGLFSTSGDYLAFARAILSRGEGEQPRLLSPNTWKLMSTNHLPGGKDLRSVALGMFREDIYEGVGFGLGWATTIDAATAGLHGTPADAFWSGMANTFFWCDPVEQLIGMFMTQILPSDAYPLQLEIRELTYSAVRQAAGSFALGAPID